MKKRICIGWNEEGKVCIDVKLEYKEGKGLRLSICGDVTNRRGTMIQAGQMNPIIGITKYADGWNEERVNELNGIWNRWHLNDMRAGCEHQRGVYDTGKQIPVNKWMLKTGYFTMQREIIETATNDLKQHGTASITPEEQRVLNLKLSHTQLKTPGEEYRLDKTEHKPACHIYETEHPEGVLCKVCPVCGYKYGSAWLFEELPTSVITWVEGL